MKKLVSVIIAVLMIVTLLPLTAFSKNTSGILDSGYCGANGDNVLWTLFNNGMLYIEGHGKMCDYAPYEAPWRGYVNSIFEINIDDGITYIGNCAFESCLEATKITIPESVTIIGEDAFAQCKSLINVTIPDSVNTIKDYAFNGCSSLKSITIPDRVTNIGEFVFYFCSSLENVTLSNSLKMINEGVFLHCKTLKNITIPCSVTTIGDDAFAYCNSLSTVYYTGTEDQWNSIDIGYGNECLIIAKNKIFNTNDTASPTEPDLPSEPNSPSDSDFLYDEVINQYIEIIENNFNSDLVGSEFFEARGEFVNHEWLGNTRYSDDYKKVYYALIDINNDGTKELVIGAPINDGIMIKYDIFTHDGKNPVPLFNVGTFGYRTQFALYDNGIICVNGSGGAFSNGSKYYTLPKNSTEVELLASFLFDYGVYYITDNNGNNKTVVSEQTYNAEKQKYTSDEIKLNWIEIDPDKKVPEPEARFSIAILTTEKSLCVEKNDTFNIGFGIMDNTTGLLDDKWKKMAVVVSDPSIISLSDYKNEEYGYSIDVTGKKTGSTNVTVTDTESGLNTSFVVTVKEKYNKSYSYNIENIATFKPANKWEEDIPTNIYDLNGLYVNNYTCKKIGDKYYISMDIYNARYHTAAIDIYDSKYEWIDCEPIEKFSDISSISDTLEHIYYLIADPITGKWLTYEQASFSKHTKIRDMEVPEGGYFTISNNYLESPGTFLFNVSEMLFNGACTLIDLVTADDIKFSEFSGLLKENVVKNEDIRKDFYEMFIDAAKNEITDYTKNIIEGNIDDACAGLSGLLENMLNSLEIKWKHIFDSVMGVGQSVFTYFAGAAGTALNGCFEFADLTSQLQQATNLAGSSDAVYATVYSGVIDFSINPRGVIIDSNGNLDYESVLQVFKIYDEDVINTIPGNSLNDYELYNICFFKNDQLVQPNGKVKVQIPIPLGFNRNSCTIYRQETDGSWTELVCYVEGNYLVFETDHFSMYAVAGIAAELSISSLPYKTSYKSGEELNTDGLVLEINGENIIDGYICDPSVISGCGSLTINVIYGKTSTSFDVVSHISGSWEVVKDAQVGVEGKEQQNCTVCGDVVGERIIPALEQDLENVRARFYLDYPYEVEVGETFDVIVSCSDIYGIESCVIAFKYKPHKLKLISTTPLLESDVHYQSISEKDGEIRDAFVFIEKCREKDSYMIIYTFQAIQPGECYIEIYTDDWDALSRPADLGASIMIKQDVNNYLLGDVNDDGKVTAADARMALRISAKLDEMTEYALLVGDINQDGKLTAADARKILRMAAQLEP